MPRPTGLLAHALCLAVLLSAGQAATAQPMATTTLTVSKAATIGIRHLDMKKLADDFPNGPAIKVFTYFKNTLTDVITLTASRNEYSGSQQKYAPIYFRKALMVDMEGDGKRDVLIYSEWTAGGSGSLRYIHVLVPTANSYAVTGPITYSDQNEHCGAGTIVRRGATRGIMVTSPAMDQRPGESRASPSSWTVSLFALRKGSLVRRAETRTPNRYAAGTFSAREAARHLPSGWRLANVADH